MPLPGKKVFMKNAFVILHNGHMHSRTYEPIQFIMTSALRLKIGLGYPIIFLVS